MFDDEILHLFEFKYELPSEFNNPFFYDEHPVCKAAIGDLLPNIDKLMQNSKEGKMFGVLIVVDEKQERTTQNMQYLAAFSGQIADKSQIPGFVPPVFDILEPYGYFKTHEKEISEINDQILNTENNNEYVNLKNELINVETLAKNSIENAKKTMQNAKNQRDCVRNQRELTNDEIVKFEKESSYYKAELKREKIKWNQKIEELSLKIKLFDNKIAELKALRQQKSEDLQNWIFERYEIVNYKGEKSTIRKIFEDSGLGLPPAGTGDCCEIKLFQYAYTHNLTPIQIAMFWYGSSPKKELKMHLKCYPACNSKCKPLLNFMLPKSVFRQNVENNCQNPEIIFEDDYLWIIDKPSGMLAVPGKSNQESVISFLEKRSNLQNIKPLVVHRLDMDTSGLMIVAKNNIVQSILRKQFENREVKKTYIAILEGEDLKIGEEGTISLPLAPDLQHRPFQLVDYENGKTAVTEYRVLNRHIIELKPLTGRTHQLRVHCAHKNGLNRPIKGDNLYGIKSSRLELYAVKLQFKHPITGIDLEFKSNINCNAGILSAEIN